MESLLRRRRVLLPAIAAVSILSGGTAIAVVGATSAAQDASAARAPGSPGADAPGRAISQDARDGRTAPGDDGGDDGTVDGPWWEDPRVTDDDTVHAARGQAELEALLDGVAQPGDLILLDRGVYPGEVRVETPRLTIRGIDRNEVVFDGEHERGNGITVAADGVVLENLRARDFTGNALYWVSVEGYGGRYLTTERIGLYGIYAFDSVDGVFEDSYASGSADAGFYIGQCEPCEAVIRNVTAEFNALGYSGTNAGGDLVIEDSIWRENAAGVVPNSLNSQQFQPQSEGTLIRGNLFEANGNPDTPSFGIAGAIIGHGVAIAGGRDNVIVDNEFRDHTKFGVVIHPLPDDSLFLPGDNTVRGNVFSGSGVADLALSAGSDTGNCFADNDFGSSLPLRIEDLYPCGGGGAGDLPLIGDPAVTAILVADFAAASAGVDQRASYRDMPDAPDEVSMPDPLARDGGVPQGGQWGMPAGYRTGR